MNPSITSRLRSIPLWGAEWIAVGPTEAAELLLLPNRNRPLSPARADKYARDMANGRWMRTSQPISFVVEGQDVFIINGQHRMRAVASSGVTQSFLFVRDVSGSIKTTDASGPRTVADAYSILFGWARNRAYRASQSSTAVLAVRSLVDTKTPSTFFRATMPERIDLIFEYAEWYRWLMALLRMRPQEYSSIPVGALAGFLLCWREHPVEAEYFAVRCINAHEVDRSDPEWAIYMALVREKRSKFARDRARTGNSLGEHEYWMQAVLKCWSYFCQSLPMRGVIGTVPSNFSVDRPRKRVKEVVASSGSAPLEMEAWDELESSVKTA